LEIITLQLCVHPLVLEVRWQGYANLEKWDGAVETASATVAMRPDWADGWIYKASSPTELNRHQEAYENLSEAAGRFPGDEINPHDPACVCCSLQRVT
jgi:hypothetical protein